jgi:RNA polymerase sigma-70 factor (ECF subfamily)
MGTGSHADDIVQEAYLRLLRHPPSSDAIEELRPYLFRIASNLIIDRWRSQKNENAYAESAVPEYESRDAHLSLDLQRTFQQLRPLDRQLMWLAYVEGANHREIASSLQLREGSIRVLLSRARKKLVELLRMPARPKRMTTPHVERKSAGESDAALAAINEISL